MKYRLIEVKLSGTKSIKKEIEIYFAKRNFDSTFFDESLIKSIYGPNGCGKTAIVSAFSIYRTLLTSDFPFKMDNYEELLNNIINIETKRFSFCATFAILDGEVIYRMRHKLVVSKDELNQFIISHESLHSLNSRLVETNAVFETENGELITNRIKGVSTSFDPMVIKNNSFVKLIFNETIKRRSEKKSLKPNKNLLYVVLTKEFATKLFIVYGDKQDTHIGHFADWMFQNNYEFSKLSLNEYTSNKLKETIKTTPGVRCFDIIFSRDLEDYKKQIKKMTSFIKLLKNNLVDIEVVDRPFEQVSFVNLWFVYDRCKVDFEFESTGIKKLCLLYSAFLAAKKGGIVLIDEIDSNIHDTFLVKLFEYFSSYSNSQIICTTHNVEIMSVIFGRSKAIDFLSNDNRVVSWIKTGRLSPSTLYLKGRIPFIPFNLDSSEFAEVFIDD